MELHIEPHSVKTISDGWTLARVEPGGRATEGQWTAKVPGTVAAALTVVGEPLDALDAFDWWFFCDLDVAPPDDGEEVVLQLDGVATIADVFINGVLVLASPSMFARHVVDLRSVLRQGRTQLAIACRSISSTLNISRPRPRFRASGIKNQRLRYVRTTLLDQGLTGVICPHVVGPYRRVAIVRRRVLAVDSWSRTATLNHTLGELCLEAILRPLGRTEIVAIRLIAAGPTGEHSCGANLIRLPDGRVRITAKLCIDDVATWMPHTHGTPNLYEVSIRIVILDGTEVCIHDVSAGFRTISRDKTADAAHELTLSVSGVPIFCRGVIWTPADPINIDASPSQIGDRLVALRDAGMNIVRVPGNSMWEDYIFHNACDALGLLVWQDLMLARMDYPTEDPEFATLLTEEVTVELARVGQHASTAVICGDSEVEQQAAMLGLPPGIGRSGFVRDVLPIIAAQKCPEVPVIPSSPCGGDLPFRISAGVSHYFGVGAYLRPLTDARTAAVRFASECLAFANVPEQTMLDSTARTDPERAIAGSAAWKRGIPRDIGASWDFEDVRDHYFRLVYGTDSDELRRKDPKFYLDLSRVLTGEIMAATVGEWRRKASPCRGAIVLQSADLTPGCGWGLLDALGKAKPALAILRRVCLPRAVWTTDEGLDGIDIHLANDQPEPFACTLRVAMYRHDGTRTAEAARYIIVAPREVERIGVEQLFGRFVDANWAYRFGPRDHELVVASVHVGNDDVPFLQHFHWVGPRSLKRESIDTLGLRGTGVWDGGELHATVLATRPAWGVRLYAAELVSDDSWFALEPGRPRRVVLRALGSGAVESPVRISAINGCGSVTLGPVPTTTKNANP